MTVLEASSMPAISSCSGCGSGPQGATHRNRAIPGSASALPRSFANATTGYLVDNIGWVSFFFLCTVLALPGMALLRWVAPWGPDPHPEQDEMAGMEDASNTVTPASSARGES